MKKHFKILALLILMISLSTYAQKPELDGESNPFDHQTQTLTHHHQSNGLTVEVAAFNGLLPTPNQPKSPLEALNSPWLEITTGHNADSPNKPNGSEAFHVKGNNHNDFKSEQSATVLPFLWQMGWAYILSIVTILAIFLNLNFIKVQRQKILEKQQELKRDKEMANPFKKTNKLLKKLVAKIYNTLRTPINGIIDLVESLLQAVNTNSFFTSMLRMLSLQGIASVLTCKAIEKWYNNPIPLPIHVNISMVAGNGQPMNHLVTDVEKLTTYQPSNASFQLPKPEPLITDHCELATETVLIVDDDPVTRQVLVSYLSLQNYTTYQAASGVEALTFLETEPKPDIILLDVMMPQKNGYEVTKIIRESWTADELPIILLTAKTQVADLVVGLESGANDYLTKPVATAELLARIKTHLHLRRLKTESLRLAIENQNRLTQFLEFVPVGIVIFEVNGPFFYLNQRVPQILGTKSSEPIANLEQFMLAYPFYIAGTKQPYPTEQLPFVQALKGQTSLINNVEIRQPNQIIPLEICSTPLFEQKKQITYVINTLQDITERQMALEAQEKLKFTKELFRLNQAYERFVPSEFLSLLNKQSIVDVNFGDHVEKEMTIMFADIRGFTTLSENLSPQEIFDFINAYLSKMEPLILEHNGIIDKYIGDAIMALFPTNADDAVQGAIAMLETLAMYNQLLQGAKLEPMQIGIGLNTGPLMLGTVGGKNRMDGTVIADAVNVASRVEGLTKIYGTPLLITEQTYLNLAHPSRYHIRVIDAVKVKGKSEEVTVYEIFDAEPLESRNLKDQTCEDFEMGFTLYHWEEYRDALPCFENVLQINNSDAAAQVYLERCQNKLGLTRLPLSTILIVDDNPTHIEVLFNFLTQQDLTILTADSGSQALQAIQYETPDLVLLDVIMPDMDGFETCRRLKTNSQTHEIPIILMADAAETVDKANGLELGAVDYITKPFQLEEVWARVKTQLKLSYLQQQLQQKNNDCYQ